MSAYSYTIRVDACLWRAFVLFLSFLSLSFQGVVSMCTGIWVDNEHGDRVGPNYIVTGVWKFRGRIGHRPLVELAKRWSQSEPTVYLDLHVRACSKDQLGIGFKYILSENGRMDMDTVDKGRRQFIERTTDELKREFGNDFVGWDIGPQTVIICHKAF